MQLIAIMSNQPAAAQDLASLLWARFGYVTMQIHHWGSTGHWRRAYLSIASTDNVVVTGVHREHEAKLIESLGGTVLRLRG